MPTKTFQISPGGNFVVQGQPVILDGKATGGSATGLKGMNVVLNGFAPGSWASGDDFEFGSIIGLPNPASVTLNAAFVNVGPEVVATVLGVTTINLKLGEHDVTIEGGMVTPFGGGSPVANFSGLKTLNLLQSAGGSLQLGDDAPLTVLLTNINAQAATAKGSGISVVLDPSVITSPVTLNLSFNGVGNPGTHQGVSDDYVHGTSNAFEMEWGTGDNNVSATTWSLTLTGDNFIQLGSQDATTAKVINIKGAGGMTLFGDQMEFSNVTTINDTASGRQVITGALQQDGSSQSETGILGANTALTSIKVTSTNPGNFIDMSGFDSIAGIAISIGAGTLVLDDDVLLNLVAPVKLGTPGIIGYGGDDGGGAGASGTINFAFLPTSVKGLTLYHGVDANGTFSLINTQGNFTFNLQDESLHNNNIVVSAATPAAGNTLTVDIGNAVTNQIATEINENWAVTGFSTVNIVLAGNDEVHLGSEGGFTASSGVGSNAVTINLSGKLMDSTDVEETHFGNIDGASITDFTGPESTSSQSARGVTTFDGKIVDTATTFLELGTTDAAVIDASKGGGLFMADPGTDIDSVFTVTGSTGNFNVLQGTFGLFTGTAKSNSGAFGFAGSAILTGGKVADHIFDTGGTETIFVNNSHTKVFYSQFVLNGDDNTPFAITDDTGAFSNNFGAGPGLATIKGFNPTGTGFVDFNSDSWGVGGKYGGLVEGDLNPIAGSSHFANVFILTGSGAPTLSAGSDLIALDHGTFTSAAAAAAALTGSGLDVTFASGNKLANGQTIDFLIAFNLTGGGVEIADAHLTNTTGSASANTFNFAHTGVALVNLVGLTLSQVEGAIAGSNDVIHFNANA